MAQPFSTKKSTGMHRAYDVVAGGGSREAEGPDGAEYAKAKRRFADTNCFIIDESACNEEFPERTMTRFAGGPGGYRQVVPRLHDRPREQPAYTLFTTYGAWLACLRTCFGGPIVPRGPCDCDPSKSIPGEMTPRGFADIEHAEGHSAAAVPQGRPGRRGRRAASGRCLGTANAARPAPVPLRKKSWPVQEFAAARQVAARSASRKRSRESRLRKRSEFPPPGRAGAPPA